MANDGGHEELKGNQVISRRKMLASLGIAGVAVAAQGLMHPGATASADEECCCEVTTIAGLRANTTPDADCLYFVSDAGQEGLFLYDLSDTTSADNTGTILVSSSYARFKRKVFDNVNVQWFGAKGDGIADDAAAIQAAIDTAHDLRMPVFFPAPVLYYLVGTTLLLPSDAILSGNRSELKSIPVDNGPYYEGFIPTMILKNADSTDGNRNITIRGLVFNGGYLADGATYDPGQFIEAVIRKPKEDAPLGEFSNTLRFTKVINLVFEDVEIYNCATNWNSAYERDYVNVLFDRCEYVSFDRVLYKDSRIEGLYFYRCNHVKISNYRSYHRICHSWTSFHMWYCTDVSVDNSTFEEDINLGTVAVTWPNQSVTMEEDLRIWDGSTINICVQNGKFTNCTFIGGKGIGLDNENNEETFFQEGDVVFDNCYVEVGLYGFYRAHYENNSIMRHLTIQNCTILAADRGARVEHVDGFWFANNDVATTSDYSAGVAVGGTTRNGYIVENKVNSHALLWSDISGVTAGEDEIRPELTDIAVRENHFTALPLGGETSYSGQSCCIYFRNFGISEFTAVIRNLTVSQNLIHEAEGGFVTFALDAPEFVQVSNLVIEGNQVNGSASANTERPMQLMNCDGIIIRDNRFHNVDPLDIYACSNIHIETNRIDWDTELILTTSPYLFRKCEGEIILLGNIAPDTDEDYGQFTEGLTTEDNDFTLAVMQRNEPNTGTNLAGAWKFGRSRTIFKYDSTSGGTVSVKNMDGLIFMPPSAINVTNFNDEEYNQIITLYFDNGNTTIKHNTYIQLKGGVDYVGASGKILTLAKFSSVTAAWFEMSRNT